ncbi:MAG: hypothetical protein KGI25_09765 [Thaumarchaeota archaeon]|nr:hypothetical protein [Nitrososphaerota archaeon]
MANFPDTLRINNPKLHELFDRLDTRNGRPTDRKGMIGDIMICAHMTQEEAEQEAISIMEIELIIPS